MRPPYLLQFTLIEGVALRLVDAHHRPCARATMMIGMAIVGPRGARRRVMAPASHALLAPAARCPLTRGTHDGRPRSVAVALQILDHTVQYGRCSRTARAIAPRDSCMARYSSDETWQIRGESSLARDQRVRPTHATSACDQRVRPHFYWAQRLVVFEEELESPVVRPRRICSLQPIWLALDRR